MSKKSAIFLFINYFSLSLFLSGCVSIPSASSPSSRFYLLQSPNGNPEKINSKTTNLFFGIGPVKLPQYIDRPQIVTEDNEGKVKFAEFDRWGEPLDLGIARLVSQQLADSFPDSKFSTYPWNFVIPVQYQVLMQVVRLDSQLDKGLSFEVQWEIIDLSTMKTVFIKRSKFQEPIDPHNYSGLVKALSQACISLSNEIAQTVFSLNTQPK